MKVELTIGSTEQYKRSTPSTHYIISHLLHKWHLSIPPIFTYFVETLWKIVHLLIPWKGAQWDIIITVLVTYAVCRYISLHTYMLPTDWLTDVTWKHHIYYMVFVKHMWDRTCFLSKHWRITQLLMLWKKVLIET